MNIEVKTSTVRQERTSKGTILHKQQVAMHQGKDYPLVFDVTIATGQDEPKPYQPGKYSIDPTSFRLNRFGSVELDPYGLRLVPVK
jgi:hypothetical protein